MVISVFRKVDCDLTVIYNRFYFVFRINVIFIYIVFVQIITCSLFSSFICSSIYLSAFAAELQRHITHTPIKAPTKRPIIKPNTLTPSFSNFLLNTPTAENKKSSAVGIISIVLDSSNFHAILLSLFILDTLRQGTHQTAIAL